MIDTDYNPDSFFIRHCCFTRWGHPHRRLKSTLIAEIDSYAWASLDDTESRPSSLPPTVPIGVMVVNDDGAEGDYGVEIDWSAMGQASSDQHS